MWLSTDLIESVERSGNRTWPALEEHALDGWLLRFARGMTRRANSVTVYHPSTLPVDEKLDRTEAWYRDRGRVAIFRTTPLTDEAVHAGLDARGYDDVPGALVLGRDLTDIIPGPVAEVTVQPTEAWWSVFDSDRPVPIDRPGLETMWATQPVTPAFVVGRRRDQPVAVGSVVVDGPLAGIFNMRTLAGARRRGHARQVLEDILSYARDRGAIYAYLQMVEDNDPARGLYAGAGFKSLYAYRYRSQRPAPSEVG